MGWGDVLDPTTWPGHFRGGLEKVFGPEDMAGKDGYGQIRGQSDAAGLFADQNSQAFNRAGSQLRQQLGDQASGKVSLSAEQLRQGLQQNLAAQNSMAASARPGSAPMAARTAAMNAGRMGAGLSGQQAIAGIAERQAAQQGLMGLRGQDLQAALGSRGQAIGGYGTMFGANAAQPSMRDNMFSFGKDVASFAALASDRRLKTKVADGDADADALLSGLKAYTYDYKDEKHGKGRQLGVMAQDLERSGLGRQAIVETPEGKKVDPGKLAGALAAASARMHQRIERLEKDRK